MFCELRRTLPWAATLKKCINNSSQRANMTGISKCPSSKYTSVPLIVIIGATGCGKTRLSLELAGRFNGEVISADSMQIYRGLDIATAKATVEEQAQVPHHLLSEVDPFKQFTVLDFQRRALAAIDDILARKKVPVIVGGTNYYIESILWDTLVGSAAAADSNGLVDTEEMNIVAEEAEQSSGDDQKSSQPLKVDTLEELLAHPISYRRLGSVPSEALHSFLVQVDPLSAAGLHPHNRRKVIRALQVYQSTGGQKRWSDLLAEQRQASSGGSRHGGPLRFDRATILWVDCEREVLEARLDRRVDQMMTEGLIEELRAFHRQYNSLRLQQNRKADYTEGIFQAIGLKEFHRYLLMPEEEQLTSYEASLALGRGILLLKQRTKGYVTRQLKWIRRRFLVPETVRRVPPVYRLDTSQLDRWPEDVLGRAVALIEASLKDEDDNEEASQFLSKHREPLLTSATSEDDDAFISGQFTCQLCQMSISGGKSYQMHLRSKGHRARQAEVNRRKREEESGQEATATAASVVEDCGSLAASGKH